MHYARLYCCICSHCYMDVTLCHCSNRHTITTYQHPATTTAIYNVQSTQAAALLPLLPPQVWLWNLESGAVRRKLLPQGHASRPVNEQPVERLAFMHGDARWVARRAGIAADCAVLYGLVFLQPSSSAGAALA